MPELYWDLLCALHRKDMDLAFALLKKPALWDEPDLTATPAHLLEHQVDWWYDFARSEWEGDEEDLFSHLAWLVGFEGSPDLLIVRDFYFWHNTGPLAGVCESMLAWVPTTYGAFLATLSERLQTFKATGMWQMLLPQILKYLAEQPRDRVISAADRDTLKILGPWNRGGHKYKRTLRCTPYEAVISIHR